jgi:FkbM family methyltransferase
MFPRWAIRAILPHWSIEWSRWIVAKLDPLVRLSYSHEGEDMVLRRILHPQNSGFYVDVGAHHPFRFSNTCYFHRLGWHGINIDPNPESIKAFDLERPLDVNLCVGVSDMPGNLSYFVFTEPALNTFDPELVAERKELRDFQLLETREVRVRRLDDLLTEHLPCGQRIDFISIDVEGLDLQVLKSNDWRRFRPRILLVEARALEFDQLDADPVNVFAVSAGYKLVAKTVSTLIYEDASFGSSSNGVT